MSGPIVRSGPSTTFTKNWESAFGQTPAKPKKKKATELSASKPAKKKKK